MDNCEVSEKTYVARDVQPTVLRLHPEVRAELVRLAHINGRSLSKEIAIRLDESLKADVNTHKDMTLSYPGAVVTVLDTAKDETPMSTNVYMGTSNVHRSMHAAQEKGPADLLSEIDRAMLGVFRRMPPEKQLALLSLFR